MQPVPAEVVIIIGAPRSGTNILRDALTRLKGVGTWPCDEINAVWRHGNAAHPTDEFTAGMARPDIRRFIRRRFHSIAKRCRLRAVVEKTCANSLRVPFVDRVLPEARYLFLFRNGLDAVDSARRRWTAGLEPFYLLKKARFVPPSDLPRLGLRFAANRFHRLRSGERRIASWGPRFDGMDDLLGRHPLETVCALQWKRCVDRAHDAFARMPGNRCLAVRYEAFATSPVPEFERIAAFLGFQASAAAVRTAVSDVNARSVGKGRGRLGTKQADRLMALIEDTMGRCGYG